MATATQERVYAAAEAIEAAGGRASVRAVRDHLGGGSPNQITPFLAAWRAKKPVVAAAEIQLDPRIGQLIAEQVRVAAGEAAKRADERAAEAEDTLALCQQENAEIAEQLATTLHALDESRAKGEQQAGTISELREEIERVRREAEEEVTEAQARADRERESAETARQALARAELRLEALPRLEAEVERLRAALEESQSGRQSAEQQAAVATAKLEAAAQRVEAAEERERDARQQAGKALETAQGVAAEAKAELKEIRAEIKKGAKGGGN